MRSIAALNQHVLNLAADHHITLHWRERGRAYAAPEFLEIWLPRIRSPLTYGTALHELGHCLGRYQASRATMVAERWAWRWAKQKALVWTAAMERDMHRALAWHEANSPRRREISGPPGCHVDIIEATPEHPVDAATRVRHDRRRPS
jgi:hypothetical protein